MDEYRCESGGVGYKRPFLFVKDNNSEVRDNSKQLLSAQYANQSQHAMTQGVIRPTPNFNPQDDAKQIKQAMKGIGCNSRTIMGILCR